MLPETISTDRLVLSPWSFEDLASMMEYVTDPEWGYYLPVPQPYGEEHGRGFLAQTFLLNKAEHQAWAVRLAGKPIGGVNMRFFADGRIGELGYSIARAQWGKGFASEAAGAVVEMAFAHIPQMIRIRALADVTNVASRRVLEKVGMRLEGLMPQNRATRDRLMDEAWYGRMRE